jgi:hypothetical protein
VDGIFLAYDLGKLGVALYTGVGVPGALADAGASVVGVFSPIPGGRFALQALKYSERGAEMSYTLVRGAEAAGSVGKAAEAATRSATAKEASRGVDALLDAAAGKVSSSGDVVVHGGRDRAKELFREFDVKGAGNRDIVRDKTGGGRGVEGALSDGTPLRIRMKPDGSTRIQAGDKKLIFPSN